MTSELINHFAALLDRWDTLSAAAVEKMEIAQQPEQADFYAGMLFGMEIARDELAAALAQTLTKPSQPLSDLMNPTELLSN